MYPRLLVSLLLILSSQSFAESSLTFGSYGRVGMSTNSEGGRGQNVQINAYAPRLTEGNYLELDFGSKTFVSPYGKASVLTTLAFDEGLFHYDGQWQTNLALRRFQLSVTELLGTQFFLVVGSQWNRGDDIYLLNFWPLDDVNSSGLTIGYQNAQLRSAAHIGVSRLSQNRQLQFIDVTANDFGGAPARLLDRQRLVTTASHEHFFRGGKYPQKLKLYAEYHHLPSGRMSINGDPDRLEDLMDDRGYLVGAQYGLWGFGDNSHLNLFIRHASGLAVFDELATASSINRDRRAVDAKEGRIALSANLQTKRVSVLLGGYARFFDDGDVNREDFDDRQEVSFSMRPMLRLGAFTPAVETSIQLSRPNGLNPRTGQQSVAQVIQIAAVPAFTFAKNPGGYDRPQIRGILAYSILNQAALDYYPEADPRSLHDSVWFMGLMAEWWFGRGGSY